MWRIFDDYERFHAQIVINNDDVYSPAEVRRRAAFSTAASRRRSCSQSRFVSS